MDEAGNGLCRIIMACAVCSGRGREGALDGLDGAVARKTKTETIFGATLDALIDKMNNTTVLVY